jgi:hypothetical protein
MSKEDLSLPLRGQAPADHHVEDDVEMLDVGQDEREHQEMAGGGDTPSSSTLVQETRPPRETRKDKDLSTFLKSMDKYAPIVYILNT